MFPRKTKTAGGSYSHLRNFSRQIWPSSGYTFHSVVLFLRYPSGLWKSGFIHAKSRAIEQMYAGRLSSVWMNINNRLPISLQFWFYEQYILTVTMTSSCVVTFVTAAKEPQTLEVPWQNSETIDYLETKAEHAALQPNGKSWSSEMPAYPISAFQFLEKKESCKSMYPVRSNLHLNKMRNDKLKTIPNQWLPTTPLKPLNSVIRTRRDFRLPINYNSYNVTNPNGIFRRNCLTEELWSAW